jgi:hypothetical protein
MRKSSLFFMAVLLLAGVAITQTKAPSAGTYRLLKTIAIGGAGGWDYLATDESGRRVYVTHSTKVLVYGMDQK